MTKDEQTPDLDTLKQANGEEQPEENSGEDVLAEGALEEKTVPPDEAALMALIRQRTEKSKVSGSKWLKAQKHPALPNEKLEELLTTIQEGNAPETLAAVHFVKMGKDTYYYDSTIMTDHFAELDAMIEEKDILHTIASVTRSDCELYPRPTQFSKMMGYPFRFSLDEVEGAAARMQLDERYQDIQVVTASNGAKAFFSTLHMSRVYASGLLEDIEVNEKRYQ